VTNRTVETSVTVLVDGTTVGELGSSESLSVGIDEQTSQLAVLPEVTFFSRYHEVFP
jgi:hypothetical protein